MEEIPAWRTGKAFNVLPQILLECTVISSYFILLKQSLFVLILLVDFIRVINGANLGGQLGDGLGNFSSIRTM